jgi:hypothetical protein
MAKPKRFVVSLTFELEVEAPNPTFAIWSAKYRVRSMRQGQVVRAEAVRLVA